MGDSIRKNVIPYESQAQPFYYGSQERPLYYMFMILDNGLDLCTLMSIHVHESHSWFTFAFTFAFIFAFTITFTGVRTSPEKLHVRCFHKNFLPLA